MKKGLPLKFIKNIIKGHTENKLCSKHKNKTSKYINNNVGVFQGSPISAQLFVIYADKVIQDYKEELIKCQINNTTIRLCEL